MRSISTIALSAALGTTASAAFAETDPWALLSQIQIDEIVTDTTYEVKKIFPAEIRDGVERFEITGYAMPMSLEPGQPTTSLLLVSDMGDCPFCGSTEHGGSLEVQLDEAVVIKDGARISVIGALEMVDDPETWQAAIMRGARITGS